MNKRNFLALMLAAILLAISVAGVAPSMANAGELRFGVGLYQPDKEKNDATYRLLAEHLAAEVDVFASTHTCLPAMRRFGLRAGRAGWVLNNGAAGMPNFAGDLAGLCTRIGKEPSPHLVLHETRIAGVHIALLSIRFDASRWRADFLSQWPPGSPAWLSYFGRINQGPAFTSAQAVPSIRPQQFA
jgi:hypothetical protein